MRFRWFLSGLIPGILGVAALATSAEAGQLQYWRYDRNTNQLVFTTDEGVQPTAQLIANPTRLVIDLPGTTLGGATSRQQVGGLIREIRAGQFDSQTTRLVIELSPGYSLNPQQIQVRGITPTQWTVTLPTPERVETPPVAQSSESIAPPTREETSADAAAAPIQLESVRVTADGIFLRTRGGEPELEIDRDEDDREITVDLENTGISPRITLAQRDQTLQRPDISRLQIAQVETDPPVARITLTLPEDAPNWQATVSDFGGIVLIPQRGTAIAQDNRPPRVEDTPPPREPVEIPRETSSEVATIESVELSDDNTQLLIQASQSLTYTSQWNRRSAAYEIRIPSARLADEVEGPDLDDNSPLRRVRLQQEANDIVLVTIQPAASIRFGTITRPEANILAIPVQQITANPPAGQVSVSPPSASGLPPAPTTSAPLPSVQNSRVIVTIDPGHGGADPGAVGIGGIREKDIVLAISLEVASLLQQQGLQVVITRSSDFEIDLQPRVDIAERANSDLFVSIHANAISLSRPDVNGLETYYYSASGQRLARVVHDAIIQTIPVNDRGVRQARFYVIRNTSMPAILVETGFVTGASDAPRLSDPAYQSQMANAIAQGILRYVQQNF